MSELLAALISEFRGDIPAVPYAPGISEKELTEGDEDPMFVTLPIVEIGGKSENGFTWDAAGVQRVIEEINSKKPEGIVGHIKPDERSHRYDLPRLRWVGATLVENRAWAKAYVPKYASDVREHFRIAKRTNSRVGTSVYGRRGTRGLADMVLESIDLGHPDRLGSKSAAAVPEITSEFEDEDKKMGDKPEDNGGLIAELRQDRATLKYLIAELKLGDDPEVAAKTLVSEMTSLRKDKETLTALISEMGLDEAQPVASAKAIVEDIAAHRQRELVRDVDELLSETFKESPETLRLTVREFLVETDEEGREVAVVKSKDEAKTRIAELQEKPVIKSLAQSLVSESRGPNAFVNPKGDDKGDWRDAAAQAGYAKAKEMGFPSKGGK